MAKIDVLNAAGKKSGSRDLSAEIFEAKVNVPLMHQVVVAGLAGLRRGTHSTKTRGDVSGGGGVAHGPHPRDHDVRVNKKMRKGALRSALTDAVASGKLVAIDEISFDDPKTKPAAELLQALGLEGKVLVVTSGPSGNGSVEKSFRNMPTVHVAYAGSLGVYEVLLADRLLVTAAGLDVLEGKAGAS